ncbi:MAG: tRNA guanosine(34) transglycosylase Tgt [Sphingomonadales bacterium]|nr:tRNA guanosine(34) transglycosylase Tgt [Sphingomonadales bacterium]
MTERFAFEVAARDGVARTGAIRMQRGEIRTPAFMPLGTAASVKAMRPESVLETGADIILGNTYHLMLRPGAERIQALGGLHRFMNWLKPILTDSGGFQVMSLAKLRKLDEDGVTFQSHIDGSRHRLTPERAIEIQGQLGADIVMAFDECTSYPASEAEARESMELSMRWALRSRRAFDANAEQAGRAALFGIVQGSTYPELRHRSTDALLEIGFDGYAVGGLAVGEGQEEMLRMLDVTVPRLPEDAPRYLMGVGKPDDLVGAVLRGIDMFDCVLPTRSGRTGQAFTWAGPLNLKNARHKEDTAPIDPACRCPACIGHSRAYLHYLFKADEMLGPMLLTWHNLTFYQDLMAALRDAISRRTLSEFAEEFRRRYSNGA